MSLSKSLHGGNLWQTAEKYRIPPDEIIDFSANINPWGNLLGVIEAIRKNMASIFHYPDPEYRRLTLKLSEFLKIEQANIVVGNGATEIIYLVMMAIRPERAIIPVPTFTEYERALRLTGGKVKSLYLKEGQDFTLDTDELIKMAKNVQMIILCNPNNPTGKLLSRSKMQRIVDEAKKMGKFVVIDESFIDFQLQQSLMDTIKTNQNIFIVRSFTKFFSIAGLRLGYGVGNKKLIAKIKSIKQPWTVNSLAEAVGIQILENTEKFEKLKTQIENEKNFLYKNLFKIDGMKPYTSDTNFILIKIKTSLSSSWLTSELAKKGILIRDCSNFVGLSDKFVRMAVRKREENKKLIYNLEQILRSKI